jgi:hypothetical protein
LRDKLVEYEVPFLEGIKKLPGLIASDIAE